MFQAKAYLWPLPPSLISQDLYLFMLDFLVCLKKAIKVMVFFFLVANSFLFYSFFPSVIKVQKHIYAWSLI